MSDDRRFEPDHIYDLPPLSPSADHGELLEHQHREDQWRRTREPVAAGSKFLKFLTWRDMVDIGLLTEEQVLRSDSPFKPVDPNGPEGSEEEIDDARVYAYARDFDPNTDAPCAALAVVSFGAGKPDAQVLAFDPSTNEAAETQLILPPEWPGKSLQCRIYWSHPLATSWGVVWEVQAHSAKDGENMAVDYVPGMVAVDEGGDTNHLYISASNVVTIETGNAMPGDLVFIKVIRRTDHADDTLNADAYFHAIEFLVGNSPAEFPEPPPTGYEAALLLRFDGNFADSSVHNHSVTANGGISRGPSGVFGLECLEGGSGGYLEIPDSEVLEIGAQEWAFDCQVYISSSASLGATNAMAAKWSVSPNRLSWIFGIKSTRKLQYITGNGDSFGAENFGGDDIPLDEWVHCAIYMKKTPGPPGTWGVYFAVAGHSVAGPGGIGSPGVAPDTDAPVCIGGTEYGDAMLPSGVRLAQMRLVIGDGLIEYDGSDFTPPTSSY